MQRFWLWLDHAWWIFKRLLALVVVLFALTYSITELDPLGRARGYTRAKEFDFVNWTVDAQMLKLSMGALDAPRYMRDQDQVALVLDYMKTIQLINAYENELERIYADPNLTDKAARVADITALEKPFLERRDKEAPLAEAILQQQTNQALAGLGLTLGGQSIPPLIYRVTPLPMMLIISPRDRIETLATIPLDGDLTLEQIVAIEDGVAKVMNVSTMITNIGGVGVYPPMVYETSDLTYLAQTIAHEWVHNYLTLSPFGWSYFGTGQMRTANETVANLAGKEIARVVLARYYPDYLPPEEPTPTATPQVTPTPQTTPQPTPQPTPEPQGFVFRKEMRITRVEVDRLLAEGKVDEAEAYMETRRRVFWDNGYLIRRLNQAYFAFYGAYADDPGGGAWGEDPVGPAVRALRAKSSSLADFFNRLRWITNFGDLQNAAGQ